MAYLPLFPLDLVVYPGEHVNLHIFEPRYRELIRVCLEEGRTFGIPAFLNGELPGFGTEMEVSEVATRYEDGRLDIRTLGLRVFQLLDFENPAPGKLYAGGNVELQTAPDPHPGVLPELLQAVERLYELLKTPMLHRHDGPQPYSYRIAHGVGLSKEDEYHLLTIADELDRQLFLLEHLKKIIPTMENIERTRQRIQMNGNFREFGPLDL